MLDTRPDGGRQDADTNVGIWRTWEIVTIRSEDGSGSGRCVWLVQRLRHYNYAGGESIFGFAHLSSNLIPDTFHFAAISFV